MAAARLPARAGHRRRSSASTPRRIGVILGGHGITAWGDTSDECEAHSLEIIAHRTAVPRRTRHAPSRSGPVIGEPLPRAGAARPGGGARPAHPRAGFDRPAGRSGTSPTPPPCSTSWPGSGTRRWPLSAPRARTTSCAPRCGRCCSTCRPTCRCEAAAGRLRELHEAYREDYRAYYKRYADASLTADARRGPGDRAGARRRDVQLRRGRADGAGGGRVLPQRDQRDARRRSGVGLRSRYRRARSSASSTGSWKRPSCAAAPSRSRWPGGSRWSPGAVPASAGPPPGRSPPRARAWSSPIVTASRPARSRPSSAPADVARRP